MKNKIKLKLVIGHDRDHKEQTDVGVLVGKEVSKTIYVTKQDAQDILQNHCDRLGFNQSIKFINKYSK